MAQHTPVDNYVRHALDLFAGFGEREAIVAGDRRMTYTQAEATVRRMAAVLLRHGVKPGDAVGVLVHNPLEGPLLQLALHLLGCRSAWIAPNSPGRHRVDYLHRAEVSAFVYDVRVYIDLGEQLATNNPDLAVFCLGSGGVGPDLIDPDVPPVELADLPAIEHEPQSLFQTGGTTGRPKLVHHRHLFFQTLLALSEQYVATGQPHLNHLAVSGIWHVSGQVPALMTLFTGGTFFPYEGFDAGLFLEMIEQERITSLFLTPPLLSLVLDHPQLAKTDTSTLVMVSVGGSAAAPSLLARAIERFGPVLRPVYGLSEAAFVTALPGLGGEPRHVGRLTSCGLAYGDTRIEVRDDNGETLPVGEVGEVWVTGGLTMTQYWGEPDATAQTLVDGWLRTGDVGYLDEEGYLFLVDRTKDMIITGVGSTNVYSRPVEDSLAAHPEVAAAAVVGVPDSDFGEAVHGYVVLVPGATVTPGQLRDWVVTDLNQHWAPREVEIVESLPLTEVGKIDKKALRARYAARPRPS